MATQTKLPDQADIIALNEKLTADLAAANTTITTLTAERDAATKASDAAKADAIARASEIVDLKAKLATAEQAVTAFDLKVAARIVELGFAKCAPVTAQKGEIQPGAEASDTLKGRDRVVAGFESTGALMAKFVPGLARN